MGEIQVKLQLSELTKKYNDKLALDHITFSFTSGIYGLLGPNGAGKSTMMNLITDNISPTSGRILIDDRNIKDIDKEYRKLLGYMPYSFKMKMSCQHQHHFIVVLL